MIGVVIVTHGDLGESLIKTAEMIGGEQEEVYSIGLHPNYSIDEFEDELEEIIYKADKGEGVIILSDLYGGSPSTIAAKLALKHDKVEVITGVNIPVLLEILYERNIYTIEILAANSVEKASSTIIRVKSLFK